MLTDLGSNKNLIKLATFQKYKPQSHEESNIVCEVMNTIFHLNNVKEAIAPCCSSRFFSANPKGKPLMSTLQMKTFYTSNNIKCQLCFKIFDHPSSEFMY